MQVLDPNSARPDGATASSTRRLGCPRPQRTGANDRAGAASLTFRAVGRNTAFALQCLISSVRHRAGSNVQPDAHRVPGGSDSTLDAGRRAHDWRVKPEDVSGQHGSRRRQGRAPAVSAGGCRLSYDGAPCLPPRECCALYPACLHLRCQQSCACGNEKRSAHQSSGPAAVCVM